MEVEARLLAQADQMDGLEFNGLSCGIGNGGGLCVTTTLRHDVQVHVDICRHVFAIAPQTQAYNDLHSRMSTCRDMRQAATKW
jgi:hypothetical protein